MGVFQPLPQCRLRVGICGHVYTCTATVNMAAGGNSLRVKAALYSTTVSR